MRTIIILGAVIFSISYIFCQPATKTYDSHLLIPYNDHGNWGFCDTLGNIMIKPAFSKVEFFRSQKLNGENQFISYIETPKGSNILLPNGKTMLPKKLHLERKYPLWLQAGNKSTFLVSKKGKYGLFAYGSKLTVPTKYDTTLVAEQFFFAKKSSDLTFSKYQSDTEKLVSTDIISLEWVYTRSQGEFYMAKQIDGSYLMVKNGVLTPLTEYETDQIFEKSKELVLEEVMEDMELDEESSMVFKVQVKDVPEVILRSVDEVIEKYDYSSLRHLSLKYGFIQLYIAKKDGLQGLLNEKGEEILPFEYDKIGLNQSSHQIHLVKNKKIGLKILFTHYPLIEAKYDRLYSFRNLYVRNNWSFGLFRVSLGNDQILFVGENGVEYFNMN